MARNVTKKPDLTPRQARVIEVLLREPNIGIVAQLTGVSKRQIFRWLNAEPFSKAYREAKNRLLEGTLTALQAASTEAVSVLRSIMNDKNASVYARLGAAKSILELSLKAREVLDVEERLADLERRLDPGRGWRNQ
jgi:hypothetical protein